MIDNLYEEKQRDYEEAQRKIEEDKKKVFEPLLNALEGKETNWGW